MWESRRERNGICSHKKILRFSQKFAKPLLFQKKTTKTLVIYTVLSLFSFIDTAFIDISCLATYRSIMCHHFKITGTYMTHVLAASVSNEKWQGIKRIAGISYFCKSYFL